jgi:hypothetical protein
MPASTPIVLSELNFASAKVLDLHTDSASGP